MRPLFFLAATVASTAGIAACSQGAVSPPPFGMSLRASPTSAAVGDSVTFTGEMQGPGLQSVSLDYDDGSEPDVRDLGGGTIGRVTIRHAFDSAATYTVIMTVTDVSVGSRTTNATVQIH